MSCWELVGQPLLGAIALGFLFLVVVGWYYR